MELTADKKSLKNLLAVAEQQFRIPPYQRPYAWTSEQIDDLWDDLVANLAGGQGVPQSREAARWAPPAGGPAGG